MANVTGITDNYVEFPKHNGDPISFLNQGVGSLYFTSQDIVFGIFARWKFVFFLLEILAHISILI